jgi:tRNA pseudouridine55 synthase
VVKAKRGATDLCGVIAVDKPSGMTSHDVVARLRRFTGEGRIGHAGTLDPAATGLLLVCIGPATRLSNTLMAGDKTYEARVVFGAATDTDDAEGTVVAEAPVPAELANEDFARTVLAGFIGEQEQMPPHYSAIKKQGKKAYELARAGKLPELEPRPVTIHALHLVKATAGYWDIEATVSKGTYVRSLARDLGEAVGSRAHLGALRRTRSGQVSVEQAHTLEELEALTAQAPANISTCFLDPTALPSALDSRPPAPTTSPSASPLRPSARHSGFMPESTKRSCRPSAPPARHFAPVARPSARHSGFMPESPASESERYSKRREATPPPYLEESV